MRIELAVARIARHRKGNAERRTGNRTDDAGIGRARRNGRRTRTTAS